MSERCDQCGVTAPTAMHHEDHGALCSLRAARQVEHDERRSDDADRWDG